MSRNILCRIIRSCFPDRGLSILDRKIARIRRLKDRMEANNRNYYGESYYRELLGQIPLRGR